MNLHFIDDNADVANALKSAFERYTEVKVLNGDLLSLARNCVVSPANAQGFMDGGVDRSFVSFFGLAIEQKVRDAIHGIAGGRLALGSSLVVNTGHPKIPHLLVATTMESPEMVDPSNAYRAMRAILRLAAKHPEIGRDLYSPGLCTGVGGVHPANAVREMARAYGDWKKAEQTI